MAIADLIANQRPPNLLGQFTQGLGTGAQLGQMNAQRQQQGRINELLQQSMSGFGGDDFNLTEQDKINAQLLISKQDIGGLVNLKNKIQERGQKANKETFEREDKLRKQFDTQSKDFIKIRDAHTRVLKAAEDPSAAGDLALIFNYMKVLDPGSTVREGEFATAQGSAGVPTRIRSLYNQVLAGTRLGVNQRRDFTNRSGRLFQGQLQNQKELERKFKGVSERSGVDIQNVVFEYRLPTGQNVQKKVKELTQEDLNTMPIEELEELHRGLLEAQGD